jgi:MoxR-vWA-beta-propeller ternary system domain bpX4
LKISTFLSDLFETGQVTVGNEIEATNAFERAATLQLLQKYYTSDSWHFPAKQPGFHADGALWGAQFVYAAVHLTVLRHIDAEIVEQLLTDFTGDTTPETLYSVDLTFRYLPELLFLAKGLAPSDNLVDVLKTRLQRWSLSAVGIDFGDAEKPTNTFTNTQIIAQHPALRQAYVDRIIEKQDLKRALHDPEREWVKTALGDYPSVLWADFSRNV